MIGRPVSFHAMRGISAHSNGFHTCRALHLLQMLLGAVDTPGSYRFEPPFPRPAPPGPKPAGKPGQVKPNTPMPGPPLGFVAGPEDLLVEADGTLVAHPFEVQDSSLGKATPTRSTCCSCTWPTWAGTAP